MCRTRVAVALSDPQFIEDLETSNVASVTIHGTGARRGRQRPLTSTAEHPQPACDTILGQTPSVLAGKLRFYATSEQLNWFYDVAEIGDRDQAANDAPTEDIEHNFFFATIDGEGFVNGLGRV